MNPLTEPINGIMFPLSIANIAIGAIVFIVAWRVVRKKGDFVDKISEVPVVISELSAIAKRRGVPLAVIIDEFMTLLRGTMPQVTQPTPVQPANPLATMIAQQQAIHDHFKSIGDEASATRALAVLNKLQATQAGAA